MTSKETPDGACPICGGSIPVRPRGSRHGSPPKTCSEACRKERSRRRERERYHRVKGSDSWKETRKAHLSKLRERLKADPGLARMFREEAAARTRAWRRKLETSDPVRHEAMKAERRAERAAWRRQLESDPEAWEAHKAKVRAWYSSLSQADRDRIYNEPRRKRGRGRQKLHWPRWALSQLGVRADKDIAAEMGVHPVTVSLKRQDLGIPAIGRSQRAKYEWTEESLALLGALPDKSVADRLGLHEKTVRNERVRRGIGSHRHNPERTVLVKEARLLISELARIQKVTFEEALERTLRE